ncbi:MAG: hypothetical protein DRJ10_10070 [Bacteroidetes bacterium]|nr:MAG: hypothetical protein DRJ10_10070 [Bacteroidota bacterium]
MLADTQIKSSVLSYSAFIIILLITFQFSVSQDCVAQYYCRNTSFSAGEKLTYNVYYNLGFINIKLADVVLWVEETIYNNKSVFLVQNSSITVQKYEWIIKVDDYYASYIDKNTMQVERHIQKTVVDDYYTDYEYRFDHSKKKLYVSIENSNTKKYLDTLNLKPCLHDLLSACYYPRNIDYSKLTVGEKISLPVILDTNIYKIYYKYLGKEVINIEKKKKLECIKIAPLLVKTSIFRAGEKMTAWLSNDKNKIPILMETNLWIGKISVRIMEYEGLRYPAGY